MVATETKLKSCFVLEPKISEDGRGYFFESFNQKTFNKLVGQKVNFVQDNQSFSFKGVLRGLHFQTGAFAQSKLVRVIKGKVLDIVVDIRKESSTFGQYLSIELTEVNHKQLYIPRGFAHGFVALEDDTIFSYKCDNYYNKSSEAGILYKDKTLNIDWDISESQLIISPKDQLLPSFESLYK